jgi:hypothetical protein
MSDWPTLPSKTAHYFVGSQYFGKSLVHGQSKSAAFFCRECAALWAVVSVEDCRDSDLFQNACEKHNNYNIFTYGQPPGSLIPAVYLGAIEAAAGSPLLLKNLPRKLLEREFAIHVANAQKDIDGHN